MHKGKPPRYDSTNSLLLAIPYFHVPFRPHSSRNLNSLISWSVHCPLPPAPHTHLPGITIVFSHPPHTPQRPREGCLGVYKPSTIHHQHNHPRFHPIHSSTSTTGQYLHLSLLNSPLCPHLLTLRHEGLPLSISRPPGPCCSHRTGKKWLISYGIPGGWE